jgi:hypothetical protein
VGRALGAYAAPANRESDRDEEQETLAGHERVVCGRVRSLTLCR